MPPQKKSTAEVEALVAKLRAASDSYYNGPASAEEKDQMDDAAFDALIDRLRALAPDHPFLKSIGAPPPSSSAVRLPYPMPSLDKIKPGEDRLGRFLEEARRTVEECVISEKLDGLSALCIMELGAATAKLYLRGDGIEGQDVSHILVAGLSGLPEGLPAWPILSKYQQPLAIRGEIIIPRAATADGQLARSFVNGILHRKDPSPEDVAKLRFVAYELMSPTPLSRKGQLHRLSTLGCEVAWHRILPVGQVTEDALCQMLQERRRDSAYDTDGLVVAFQDAPKSESTATKAKNPKDCMAFKMPVSDQFAETTVREVQWAPSAQGYLIPKLAFDPVQIGAATIQFCTAHNAKCVKEGRLGPGARVLIRRSGDVIPTLDTVIQAAAEPSFPPEGTYRWDATQTHIVLTGGGKESGIALTTAKLGHFLKTLELPGSGPATASALVEAGITDPKSLWSATAERLSSILGPKTGAALWANYRQALQKADEQRLMIASSIMPRGVGESKLGSLFSLESDARRWKGRLGAVPGGWTAKSLEAFWPALDAYFIWRGEMLGFLDIKVEARAGIAAPASATRGVICCTGFRDADLEAAATSAGFRISPTFTGQVTHLLISDAAAAAAAATGKQTEKQKAATAKGIPILTRSAFWEQYLA